MCPSASVVRVMMVHWLSNMRWRQQHWSITVTIQYDITKYGCTEVGQYFNWHTASRGHSAIAELVVCTCHQWRGSILLWPQGNTLWIAGFVDDLRFHIMERMSQNQRRRTLSRPVRQVAAQRVRSLPFPTTFCLIWGLAATWRCVRIHRINGVNSRNDLLTVMWWQHHKRYRGLLLQTTISLRSIVAWPPALSHAPCRPLSLRRRPQPLCARRLCSLAACRPCLPPDTRPSVRLSTWATRVAWHRDYPIIICR